MRLTGTKIIFAMIIFSACAIAHVRAEGQDSKKETKATSHKPKIKIIRTGPVKVIGNAATPIGMSYRMSTGEADTSTLRPMVGPGMEKVTYIEPLEDDEDAEAVRAAIKKRVMEADEEYRARRQPFDGSHNTTLVGDIRQKDGLYAFEAKLFGELLVFDLKLSQDDSELLKKQKGKTLRAVIIGKPDERKDPVILVKSISILSAKP
jgi:hypothetical protein